MSRVVALVMLAAALFVLPRQAVADDDAFEGALLGAGTGAFIGGVTSGRAEGAIAGAIAGGTAGSIIGTKVQRRPGYYWRHGDCYRRAGGGHIRVSRRYCY